MTALKERRTWRDVQMWRRAVVVFAALALLAEVVAWQPAGTTAFGVALFGLPLAAAVPAFFPSQRFSVVCIAVASLLAIIMALGFFLSLFAFLGGPLVLFLAGFAEPATRLTRAQILVTTGAVLGAAQVLLWVWFDISHSVFH